MDASLEYLIRVQEADLEVAQLRQSIAALPKHLASIEEKLRTQKLAVEVAEKAMRAEETTRRRIESDVKDREQKILKFREQSSSVKTNEQFHALQHEISFAENEIRKLEDTELDSMERSERLETTLKSARQEFAQQTVYVEERKEAARIQTAEQQARLDALSETRATLRSQVEPDLLGEFDRIAATRGGTGIAHVKDQRCLGCQMFLRPQMWNQVRQGQRVHCESCGRLLYFESVSDPAGQHADEQPNWKNSAAES